jgi:hypothetical protein
MTNKAKAVCSLCGEPMPPGEEVFKFHGYSGPCPKPPLPCPTVEAVIEYLHRETAGQFWLDIQVNRGALASVGPFTSRTERQRAHDDMLSMMRSVGATDLPNREQ